MRKICKVLLCCLLIVSLLITPVLATDARAAELIAHYNASIAETSSGELEIDVVIVANRSVLQLGASYVTLEAKINGSWEEVCTYNMTGYPEIYGYNSSMHRGLVYYDSPVAGTEYRVYVSFFARTSDIVETRHYTSVSYVA